MAKHRKPSQRPELSGVRKASREAAIGKGLPGQYNPNRSVRFASKNTTKRAARGRSFREDY